MGVLSEQGDDQQQLKTLLYESDKWVPLLCCFIRSNGAL